MIKYRIAIVCGLIVAAFLENGLRQGVLFHHNAGSEDTGNWSILGDASTRGIADERWIYYSPRFHSSSSAFGAIDVDSKIGQYLAPMMKGLPVTVAVPGAMNVIAYYADYAAAVNEYGLTDSTIAHGSLTGRGRVGHEKTPPELYLADRHVDFELGSIVSKLPTHLEPTTIAFQIPKLGLWELARLITYNRQTMDELRKRFLTNGNHSPLPLFEQIIPNFITHTLPSCSLDDAEKSYMLFQHFYFVNYPDTGLERPFVDRITELKRDSINGIKS